MATKAIQPGMEIDAERIRTFQRVGEQSSARHRYAPFGRRIQIQSRSDRRHIGKVSVQQLFECPTEIAFGREIERSFIESVQGVRWLFGCGASHMETIAGDHVQGKLAK